jgi:hypothetical protein
MTFEGPELDTIIRALLVYMAVKEKKINPVNEQDCDLIIKVVDARIEELVICASVIPDPNERARYDNEMRDLYAVKHEWEEKKNGRK